MIRTATGFTPTATIQCGPISNPQSVWVLPTEATSTIPALVVCGFHASRFLVYELHRGRLIFSAPAGGWRRPHHAQINARRVAGALVEVDVRLVHVEPPTKTRTAVLLALGHSSSTVEWSASDASPSIQTESAVVDMPLFPHPGLGGLSGRAYYCAASLVTPETFKGGIVAVAGEVGEITLCHYQCDDLSSGSSGDGKKEEYIPRLQRRLVPIQRTYLEGNPPIRCMATVKVYAHTSLMLVGGGRLQYGLFFFDPCSGLGTGVFPWMLKRVMCRSMGSDVSKNASIFDVRPNIATRACTAMGGTLQQEHVHEGEFEQEQEHRIIAVSLGGAQHPAYHDHNLPSESSAEAGAAYGIVCDSRGFAVVLRIRTLPPTSGVDQGEGSTSTEILCVLRISDFPLSCAELIWHPSHGLIAFAGDTTGMVHVVAIATALACRDMVDNTEANQHDDAGADGDIRRLGGCQAHGMGVNCLTVHVWTTGLMWVCTGGDDQSISVIEIQCTNKNKFSSGSSSNSRRNDGMIMSLTRTLTKSTGNAGLKGISVLATPADGCIELATACGDQRVTVSSSPKPDFNSY